MSIYRCMTVTGGGRSIGKCGRLSHNSWLLVCTVIHTFIHFIYISQNGPGIPVVLTYS